MLLFYNNKQFAVLFNLVHLEGMHFTTGIKSFLSSLQGIKSHTLYIDTYIHTFIRVVTMEDFSNLNRLCGDCHVMESKYIIYRKKQKRPLQPANI